MQSLNDMYISARARICSFLTKNIIVEQLLSMSDGTPLRSQ